MKINFKNILTTILIVLLILLSIGTFYYKNKYENTNKDLTNKESLMEYLQDSVNTYKNENGDLVYEKNVLQTDIKTLKKNNNLLTENQKKLKKQIEKFDKEKNKDLIAAFRAGVKVAIDSLKNTNSQKVNDSTIMFIDSTEHMEYTIFISGIQTLFNPTLEFKSFNLYNEQEIDFYWGDKEYGYPEKFSIVNTNPYFNVNEMDVYVIPELNKEKIDPTNWEKFKNFFSDNKKPFLIGVGTGVTGTSILLLAR